MNHLTRIRRLQRRLKVSTPDLMTEADAEAALIRGRAWARNHGLQRQRSPGSGRPTQGSQPTPRGAVESWLPAPVTRARRRTPTDTTEPGPRRQPEGE